MHWGVQRTNGRAASASCALYPLQITLRLYTAGVESVGSQCRRKTCHGPSPAGRSTTPVPL
eukprot:5711955-Amphidinium_carterae.1